MWRKWKLKKVTTTTTTSMKRGEKKGAHTFLMLCINTYRSQTRKQNSAWGEKRLRKSAIMKTRKAFITNIEISLDGEEKKKKMLCLYIFGRLRLLFFSSSPTNNFSCISRICNLLNRSATVPLPRLCVVTWLKHKKSQSTKKWRINVFFSRLSFRGRKSMAF